MRRPVTFVLSASLAAAALACGDPVAPHGSRSSGIGEAPLLQREGDEARDRAHLDLRVERASLIAASDALSAAIQAQGIVTALGEAFASNVLFLSPRVPIIQGAGAASTFLATSPLAPTSMRWQTVKADVSSDGTQGYTWTRGFFRLGSDPEVPGVFLIYWRRAAEDEWQIAAMAFNLGSTMPQSIPAEFGTPTTKHRRYFPNTDVSAERLALLAADAAFSAMSVSVGTGPAFEAFAAPDAIATAGGLFVFGPRAIGEAYTTAPGDVVSWTPLYSDVAATGDLGFTVGNATFYFAGPNQYFYSKYLTVWQKQNTGEWKYVADLGSSRPAPQ